LISSSNIKAIIFDLDGTLWDTCNSCALGWNKVVKELGIQFREITVADIRSVTGKTHEQCIREVFLGLPEDQLQSLLAITAEEDNRMVASLGGDLYPGVREGLKKLGGRNDLYIVSNCQSGYIETFIQWANFQNLFRDIECWGNTKLPKVENLKLLMARNSVENAIYVGDTEGDKIAAEGAGIPFAYVKYGFGKDVKNKWSYETFSELVDALIGMKDIQ
jgi:phosphoglycolate phosphatase